MIDSRDRRCLVLMARESATATHLQWGFAGIWRDGPHNCLITTHVDLAA